MTTPEVLRRAAEIVALNNHHCGVFRAIDNATKCAKEAKKAENLVHFYMGGAFNFSTPEHRVIFLLMIAEAYE